MYKVFCINICRCKTNDYFRWQLTQANVNFNVRAVKNLANLADCSAVVVKCEGQCICSVSSANPLLWSLYRGLAFSLLLEIYEYSDRNVTNNLHLFAAPKSPCSSDERLETSAGLQTLAVNCCCNNACAGVHIGVLTAGNLRNLDGHAVPCTQHGVPQAQLFLINYRTFL